MRGARRSKDRCHLKSENESFRSRNMPHLLSIFCLNNHVAEFVLGSALLEGGRPDEGIAHLSEALRIDPAYYPAEYTLGLARPTSTSERVRNCHAAYLGLLQRCATVTADASVTAAYQFLQSDPLGQLELPADFDAGALMTVQVGATDRVGAGVRPVDVAGVDGDPERA